MDCHQDISKIPHDPAKKVDCTTECHLTEPSGQKKFSHKPVADLLAKSVHGKLDADGKAKEYHFQQRIYSAQELKDRLVQTGFTSVEIYGDLDGAGYGLEAKSLIAVARK